MDNTEHSNSVPFAILAALERQSHQRGAALPVEEEGQPRWRGIGFRLDGQRFVAALEEVAEVLVCPRLSPVPRTKAWVRGIANLRGSLLPVMDLGGFLGHAPTQLTRHSRILVIHQAGVHAGLLVDEVLGMRHFLDEERAAVPADLDEVLQPFVTDAFADAGGTWLRFSMPALATHPQFLQVGS